MMEMFNKHQDTNHTKCMFITQHFK